MSAPLREFLLEAMELNNASLDTRDSEEWQSGMFTFVRIAMSHPKLKTLDAEDAAVVICRELQAAGVDVSQSFDSVDPLAEMVATWGRVYPIDGGPMSLAWMNARKHPVTPLKSISPKYTAFLSIAYHLQIKQGSAAILLPVAKLAKLLGVDRRTISFYRKIAENHGLLEPVGQYRFTEKQAAEFFFRARLFDCLSLSQIAHWHQDKHDIQDLQDKQDKQENQEFSAKNEISLPAFGSAETETMTPKGRVQ